MKIKFEVRDEKIDLVRKKDIVDWNTNKRKILGWAAKLRSAAR